MHIELARTVRTHSTYTLHIWTMAHWYIGSFGHWYIWTLVHLDIWKLVHLEIGTFGHRHIWTLVLWYIWTMVHLDIGTFGHAPFVLVLLSQDICHCDIWYIGTFGHWYIWTRSVCFSASLPRYLSLWYMVMAVPFVVSLWIGLARTIYIRCTYGMFGREITKYTVIHNVYVRFWPTLLVNVYPQVSTRKPLGENTSFLWIG